MIGRCCLNPGVSSRPAGALAAAGLDQTAAKYGEKPSTFPLSHIVAAALRLVESIEPFIFPPPPPTCRRRCSGSFRLRPRPPGWSRRWVHPWELPARSFISWPAEVLSGDLCFQHLNLLPGRTELNHFLKRLEFISLFSRALKLHSKLLHLSCLEKCDGES